MLSDFLRFTLWLFLTAGIGYFLHKGLYTHLNAEANLEMLEFAYKYNVGITIVFTTTMILASQQLKEQLGFIFLISGMIKLGIYIFLIKNLGFPMEKSSFLHFFIPYVLCVVVEIIFIIKILNSTNFTKDK